MSTLYHFWSDPASQRIRLALHYKQAAFEERALDYDDDETFFELGLARRVPVLITDDGRTLTDALDILRHIDDYVPEGPPLVHGCIDEPAWRAVLDWRGKAEQILERLYAPVRPAYRGIGDDEARLKAYKAEVRQRFGMSLEALANDRYDGFAQLSKLTQLNALARHLAKNRYYMGHISIADMLLCADLHPIQVLDGISLPIDLMYYLKRVAETCHASLEEGLLAH